MGIKEVIIFAAGFVAGGLVVNKLVEKKYEDISNQEIKSVKAVYHKKLEEAEKPQEEAHANNDIPDEAAETEQTRKGTSTMRAYSDIIKSSNYSSPATNEPDLPYVITPEAYMEPNGYDKLACNYYNNDVLTDENDEPIEIEEIMGSHDMLDRMGEYETDTLYIRNDKTEADYEITQIDGAYVE